MSRAARTRRSFSFFDQVEHDPAFGAKCHPHCDCGRFIEIGNSVFMEYLRTEGGFEELPQRNVDFGGGLERLAMGVLDSPDTFRIDLLWPLISHVEELAGVSYEQQQAPLRIIADHGRALVFLAADGVVPSNTVQGYVMRRFARRAMRQGLAIGITDDLLASLVEPVVESYGDAYPELGARRKEIAEVLAREETLFRRTLSRGVREFAKLASGTLSGDAVFTLFDTYGFPPELSLEEAATAGMPVDPDWRSRYDELMKEQREKSRSAEVGLFKGGLADQSEATTQLHTATHLLYKALRLVLGDHVVQRGSNVTAERLRFDFSHPAKMTPEELAEVQRIVNDAIKADWPMSYREIPTDEAFAEGALGAFGDKYGDTVKVYTAGDPFGEWYSKEICGGPHVERTGALGSFRIIKEESSTRESGGYGLSWSRRSRGSAAGAGGLSACALVTYQRRPLVGGAVRWIRQHVGDLGKLSDVEPGHGLVGIHAEADGLVGDPKDEPGHGERIGDTCGSEHDLASELRESAGRAGRVDGETGEDAGENHADSASHHVDTDDVEGIVVAEMALQLNCSIAEQSGGDTDDQRRPGRHVTRSRRDCSETGNRSGRDAHPGRLAAPYPLDCHPGQHARSSAELSVDKRCGCHPVGAVGAAGVESEPTEPQDAGAEKHQWNVVRPVSPFPARTKIENRRQGSRPGQLVHDRSAGEVDGVQSTRSEKPPSPFPVRKRHVDDERPQTDEDEVTAKAHPLREGAGDECRRDHRELHLEGHVQQRRDRRRVRARRAADLPQHDVGQAADDSPMICAEGQPVADHDPDDTDDTDGDK